MTERERFIKTMTFQPVDRVPNHELGYWPQAYDRWLTEGLPPDAFKMNWFEGEDFLHLDRREFVPVNLGMIPGFDYEVLEETDRHIIARHGTGYVTKALKDGTSRGGRMSMDQYMRFAVETPEDFAALKFRYNAETPERYPDNFDELAKAWNEGDRPVCLCHNCVGGGLYSNMRIWMGTENLSLAFYDQPKLVHEMLEFIADFMIEGLHRALDTVRIDYWNYFEDFAFKNGPLISPAIFRKFFLPHYIRINDFLRAHGVNIITLDSDGNTEALLPLLIEAGITGTWPCEIASDMEPLRLRKEYGRDLTFSGGIDKRELAKDRAAIDREIMRKVPELIADGGFIPHVDHTVPPDVSYDNFMYYMEVKQKVLGG
jgi:uroporphyrinogen decarboxylase